MVRTLPKNNVDLVLDYTVKAGVLAWLIKVVFRGNRV